MNQFLLLSVFLAVATVSLAALTVDAPAACPTLGGSGPYGYDPTTDSGPESWGKLSPDFATCDDGTAQSPIDLPKPETIASLSAGPQPSISTAYMSYSPGSYNWALNCVDQGSCGSTSFANVTYDVLNLHFHSPSEHLLNGKQYPLEAHIVHQSADGGLAVIATMFDYAKTNYASAVYGDVPKEFGTNNLVMKALASMTDAKGTVTANLGSIMYPEVGYCSYVGSLTTPPCSEGVTFFMALHTETVTPRQVAAYRLSAGVGSDGNNRPTMPLNGRSVTCYI